MRYDELDPGAMLPGLEPTEHELDTMRATTRCDVDGCDAEHAPKSTQCRKHYRAAQWALWKIRHPDAYRAKQQREVVAGRARREVAAKQRQERGARRPEW